MNKLHFDAKSNDTFCIKSDENAGMQMPLRVAKEILDYFTKFTVLKIQQCQH
jgi:hypothetical protein